MSEKELWNKLRSGDQSALEEIYRCYFKELFSYGKKFSSDISTIEDCIQDLFIDLWNKHASLGETNAIKPYLYVAVRRKILAEIKKVRKTTDEELKESHFDAELNIEHILIAKERSEEDKAMLKDAFEQLSDRQKEILYLKYYAQMDYESISEVMDMNYQSARNLVSRAISKLSKLLRANLIIILLQIIK